MSQATLASQDTLTLFTSSAKDSAPGDTQGWEIATPRPELAPPPSLNPGTGINGGTALGLFGEYKTCVYGSWRRNVPGIQPQQHYRLTAWCKSQKIVDTRRSLFASIIWKDADGKPLRSPDYAYVPSADGSAGPNGAGDGNWAKIDYTTRAPEGAASLTLDLGMRWASMGTAWFDEVSLTPVAAPKLRTIKAATAFYNMERGETKSAAESVQRFVKLVDEKLPKGTDILCLPEGITVVGTGLPFEKVAEAIPGGPTMAALSDLAKRHNTYLCAGLYKAEGPIVLNVSVLLDRQGKLVGTYEKTHLPREESEAGITPGDTYPVFDTDFGKVGIMICWDVQFPEPARAMALQGAELLLLPIWGGNETLTRARAIENHVHLITSSYHMANMILDPLGKSLAESPGHCIGLISADITLGEQIIQPWLSDMKNRTWIERRGDIAWRIAEAARFRDVAPVGPQETIRYTLTQGHPRAYINAAELPALRQRANTTNTAERDALLAFYDQAQKGTRSESAGTNGAGSADKSLDPTDAAGKLALLYLITGEKDHATAAIRAVEKVLQIDVEGTYFPTQRRVPAALGLAYDWCHDQMSPAFRQRIARCIEAWVQAATDSGEAPDDNSGALAGHIANMIPHFLAAGIAIGDEGNGRALITRSLSWTKKFLENSKFFLEGNSYQQSYPYTCAYVSEIAAIFRLLEAGLGQNPSAEHPWFKNTINWWLYPLRSDQTFIRYGDYFCSHELFSNASYYRPIAYIANRYKDPHARWFAEQFDLHGKDEFHPLIFPASEPGDPPAKSPDDLPRTSYHQRMGVFIARGDWNIGTSNGKTISSTATADQGGTVAAFKCSPHYLHNHCHRDANSITLYHKGDLALDSGVYDGYETPHWYNYYIRTIAHNTIVVHDPDERFVSRGRPQANDGGQRFINEPHWGPRDYSELVDSDVFKDGEILEQRQAADHAYICGDASNCYSKTKLKKFLRHVVFILDYPHKAAVSMLILDEIELTKDSLTPRFLLHSVTEPAASARDRAGASDTITIQNGGGRLTATFLTPVTLEKIGGPGKEFLVDGKNYPLSHMPKGPHTPGAWRIEASPTTPSRNVTFVTMLNPTDLTAPTPPAPQLEQQGDTWIIRQGPLTVALYRNAPPAQLQGERIILVKIAKV